MLDFVIKVSKKYYTQTRFEGCKYKIKENKMANLINDDFDQVHLMNLIMDMMMNLTNLIVINLLKNKTLF